MPGIRKYRRVEATITPEDEIYARQQDKFACLMVRAIQRAIPEATFVTVDKDKIRLSIEEDGYRYEFETPKEAVTNIIRPFDEGKPITQRKFSLDTARDAWPITRQDAKSKAELRKTRSPEGRTSQPRRSPRTKNRNVRQIGRFTDDTIVSEEVKNSG
jgi:hypothetical protein